MIELNLILQILPLHHWRELYLRTADGARRGGGVNGRFSLRTLFLPCHHRPMAGIERNQNGRSPCSPLLTGSNRQRLAVRQTETAVPLPFPFSNCQTPLSQPPASGATTTAVHGRGRT
ncbi:MAG: hypothetical protein KBA85_16495, partial [Chloroflexi bacterium]|nr:hypothetical protein [Chloroflexota bacterium]